MKKFSVSNIIGTTSDDSSAFPCAKSTALSMNTAVAVTAAGARKVLANAKKDLRSWYHGSTR